MCGLRGVGYRGVGVMLGGVVWLVLAMYNVTLGVTLTLNPKPDLNPNP